MNLLLSLLSNKRVSFERVRNEGFQAVVDLLALRLSCCEIGGSDLTQSQSQIGQTEMIYESLR